MISLYVFSAHERLWPALRMLPLSLRHSALRIFLLSLLVATAGAPVFAQQFATLNLTVADPSASVITQAKVSVRNIDTGVVRTGVSDKLGLVVIPGLPAGQYALTVNAEAFSPYEAPLTLTLGQVASLQVTLHIHAAAEQVEVHDTTQGVDRERTEGSQVIDPMQISELPISDRDFIDFVLLTPTATVGRDSSTAAQSAFQETVLEISFGGLRETHSVFYGLDGIDYTTPPYLGFSELAHRLIGSRSFVLWMARTPQVAD